jgi:hypothetical protein
MHKCKHGCQHCAVAAGVWAHSPCIASLSALLCVSYGIRVSLPLEQPTLEHMCIDQSAVCIQTPASLPCCLQNIQLHRI